MAKSTANSRRSKVSSLRKTSSARQGQKTSRRKDKTTQKTIQPRVRKTKKTTRGTSGRKAKKTIQGTSGRKAKKTTRGTNVRKAKKTTRGTSGRKAKKTTQGTNVRKAKKTDKSRTLGAAVSLVPLKAHRTDKDKRAVEQKRKPSSEKIVAPPDKPLLRQNQGFADRSGLDIGPEHPQPAPGLNTTPSKSVQGSSPAPRPKHSRRRRERPISLERPRRILPEGKIAVLASSAAEKLEAARAVSELKLLEDLMERLSLEEDTDD